MTDQATRNIPEWLSLQDIARAWSEETGESAEALEGNFREWFKAFLVRNAYAEAGAGDAGIPAEMLEGRQIWRETFETFCEETGHAKPRFWFPNAPIGQTAARPAQVPEDEAATQAPDEDKPEPSPRRRVRLGGAAFTRIALALVAVVVLGLVALWAFEPDAPVAERDRDRQPGTAQLATMAPAVAAAPAPAGTSRAQTALQTPAAGAGPAPRGKSLVRSIQERLAARGYYSGPLDGSLGPKTRAAIESYQRAQRYETTGRPSRALYEALEDYRLEVLGLKLFRQGAYDQAIATYARIIERKPKDANAYFNRGLAYKNAGLDDRALADYDAAIRLDPSHRKAYQDRGNIRYQRGSYGAAIRDYMNALGLWLGLS